MKQRNAVILILLITIPTVSIVTLYCYYAGLGSGGDGSSIIGTQGPCYNVTVVISYGRDYGYGLNQTFSGLSFPNGTTAFGALLGIAVVNRTYYGSLVLVTGINSVFNNVTANLFWQYYVNGVFGPVASNIYHLANNSVVVWRYQSSRFS
nr:DUF4430 domain-containing protein [Candidatus Njordarchaeum guaymaensis]